MAPILASFTGRNQFGGSGGSGMLTSGGTEYTNGDFTIKAFFYNSGSTENLTIDSAPPGSELEIVVIGGGGGGNGGYGSGGGGGAGCINYIPAMQAVSGHTHTILVGSGGPAGSGGADNTSNNAATHGRRGDSSTFTYAGSTTFTGGGGGGGNESFYYSSNYKDSDGNSGSGGGGGDWWPPQRGGGNATRAQAWSGGYRVGPLTSGGNGSMLYGYNGGSRDYEDGGHAGPHEGSGGGGAAGMPNYFGNTSTSAQASSGGKGLYMPQYDFGSVGSPSGWFAGGGGGGFYSGGGTRTNGTGVGGYYGGGGQGAHVTNGVTGGGGVNNTGGGGGAGGYQSYNANGTGPGGHGIVLVRYRTSGGKLTKGGGDGSSAGSPALSAAHILAANPSAGDGWYWIEAAGIVRQVWCDMSNGGWMAMSGCTTSETAHRHVADLVENTGYAPANLSTVPNQTYNQGQQFINGLVRLGRQGGAAMWNVNGNLRYFNITSSAEWAPLFTRRGTNWGSTDTQHSHSGNQWLKTCYTSWSNDSGNNGGGTFGGTTVTWSGSTWGTFPYNMSGNDGLNFGYSIDPQYNGSYDHNGTAGTNWPGAHASGWSRAAAMWIRVSPNATS